MDVAKHLILSKIKDVPKKPWNFNSFIPINTKAYHSMKHECVQPSWYIKTGISTPLLHYWGFAVLIQNYMQQLNRRLNCQIVKLCDFHHFTNAWMEPACNIPVKQLTRERKYFLSQIFLVAWNHQRKKYFRYTHLSFCCPKSIWKLELLLSPTHPT